MSSSQQFIPGDIAFIKFTGEAVGVLQYRNGSNEYEVRRCIHSKKGIRYDVEHFYAWELESEADRSLKRRQDMDDFAKAIKDAGGVVIDDRPKGPSFPPTGEFSN